MICRNNNGEITLRHFRVHSRLSDDLCCQPKVDFSGLRDKQEIGDNLQLVTRAASLAHESALAADQSNEASQKLGELAGELNRLLGQFRV